MKNKHLIPLVTGVAIALIGINMMIGARDDTATSAIECVRGLDHPLLENEYEAHQLEVCRRGAKHSEDFWGELLIFALLGWGAGALGYTVGSSDVAEEERKRRVEEYRRAHPGGGP